MVQTTAKPVATATDQDATDDDLLLRYPDEGDVEAFEILVHRYE
jgi:hypothetical protein